MKPIWTLMTSSAIRISSGLFCGTWTTSVGFIRVYYLLTTSCCEQSCTDGPGAESGWTWVDLIRLDRTWPGRPFRGGRDSDSMQFGEVFPPLLLVQVQKLRWVIQVGFKAFRCVSRWFWDKTLSYQLDGTRSDRTTLSSGSVMGLNSV